MHFIDNIDFIAPLRGPVAHSFPELAYIVDSPVGGAVDLDNVN